MCDSESTGSDCWSGTTLKGDRIFYGLNEQAVNCSSTIIDSVDDLAQLQWIIYEVTLPLLISIGVLANMLDLLVLSRPSMRGVSYRYLSRLAFSDLLYLLFNIPFCFEDFLKISKGQPVSKISAFYYAHIAVPIVNIFLTMSIYIIVWLSYDRCIAVYSPHRFSSAQRSEIVHYRCGMSFLATLIMYAPFLVRQTYSCSITGDCCVIDNDLVHSKWYIFYEFLRESYSRFIPAIAITAFNVTIIFTLIQLHQSRTVLPDLISVARQDRETRLVILLLAITVLFYVSTLPSALYKIIQNTSSKFFPYLRAVADVLEVSGHVFNFVLYFLLSPEFRKTLMALHTHTINVPALSSSVGHR